MSLDSSQAQYANEKYRADALRTFISGLRRNLTDVLYSSQPEDLPTALAMALEIEANHDRHSFASNYARTIEERSLRQGLGRTGPNNNNHQVSHVSQTLSFNSLNNGAKVTK